MTPYEMDILLYYHCRVDDHPDIERQPPVYTPTMQSLVADGLITLAGVEGRFYEMTPRGHAYCESLKRVPLPRPAWITDWPNKGAR